MQTLTARLDQLAKSPRRLTPGEKLALVEVAKAAEEFRDDASVSIGRLHSALARLAEQMEKTDG